MMSRGDGSYEQLLPTTSGEDRGPLDGGTHPQNPNHPFPDEVIIHRPEQTGPSWSHVENLDEFFRRIYEYHQKGGFYPIILTEIFELVQFAFVVALALILSSCVDYAILFRDKLPPGWRKVDGSNRTLVIKTSLSDAWVDNCGNHLSFTASLALFIALLFGALRLLRAGFLAVQYWDIQRFYVMALKIDNSQLLSLTWNQVEKRICEVQSEQQLCINKRSLTELDIYQRILRYKNYLVAFVNKGLLPPSLLDSHPHFTNGFKLNLELLLFWSPWAPWENYWHLKADFKNRDKLPALKTSLSRVVLWLGLANLALSPLILIWQILYAFCQYADLIKREPSFLGARRWSLYARYYLRHFNELEHELQNRLNRAYKPSSMYLNLFTSPLLVIFAQNIMFIAGGILMVLLGLSAVDEDVVQVQHVLSIITVCGLVVAICRAFIPDENMVYCPELLLSQILAQVHYIPDSWRAHAHTHRVRQEFTHLFQYKAVFLLEELLSPLSTPLLLIFWLRPRIGQFVDFFYAFTIEVPGLGDVCSFAQMDVRKHGQEKWQPSQGQVGGGAQPPTTAMGDSNFKACGGKTELSILHFKATNPDWVPSEPGAQGFLEDFKRKVAQDAADFGRLQDDALLLNPLLASLTPLGCPYPPVFNSIFCGGPLSGGMGLQQSQQAPLGSPVKQLRGRGLRKMEGPIPIAESGLHNQFGDNSVMSTSGVLPFGTASNSLMLGSLNQEAGSGLLSGSFGPSLFMSGHGGGQVQTPTAVDMSLSMLYLHELHRRNLRGPQSYGAGGSTPVRSIMKSLNNPSVEALRRENLREEDTSSEEGEGPPTVFKST